MGRDVPGKGDSLPGAEGSPHRHTSSRSGGLDQAQVLAPEGPRALLGVGDRTSPSPRSPTFRG